MSDQNAADKQISELLAQEPSTITYSVRMDADLHAHYIAFCKDTGYSTGKVISMLVKNWMERIGGDTANV